MTIGMTAPLLKNPQMQFGAITFFARQHKGDTCGSNGLPLTPNSIIIVGRAQILKTVKSPFLCQYLDIIRGKHERTIVVSQYCGTPLVNFVEKRGLTVFEIKKIFYQTLRGLSLLHKKKIVHRSLSNENILLQDNGDIKLFNYGLFHMSDYGTLVSFPVLQVLYTAPEVFLAGPNNLCTDSKVDVWSLGICLAELALNKVLWPSLKLGQRIRKVLSLLQANTSIFEKIAREHNCYEQYLELPEDLRELIEQCLNIYPSSRPTCDELLEQEYFSEFKTELVDRKSKICEPFEIFTIKELYHWWQLAGGDVFQELKKQGLIRSSPPILSPPSLLLIEGIILGQERNPATLYDPRIIQMPLDALYQRFSHIPFAAFYPLIHSKSDIITNADPPAYNATGLPLVIKERDPEYQLHRVILLRRLLHGYPFTKDLIVEEAHKDIPPLLRGEIWAALLNIGASYETEYLRIDKYTHTTTDRQIEVDIPRCHQYNELLSSTEGHKKLKRILKAWVYRNAQYVYWQGLDSLTAPFLYLNFNDEDVFPLYKILHLWDKLLLCDSSFPIHIGLSILTQLKDRLLASGFNECILLFSDLPEVDIEKCVALSSFTYENTPRSITRREHENGAYHKKTKLDDTCIKLEDLKNELCPRISANDVIDLARNRPEKVLLIDIRNPTVFSRCAVIGSVNIPFSSVSFSENNIENVGPHSSLLRAKGDKIVVVIGDEETDLERFPKFLLQCNISKVCVLHGGFNVLLPVTPTILSSTLPM